VKGSYKCFVVKLEMTCEFEKRNEDRRENTTRTGKVML
jgi:hypothetical protein